MKEEELTPRIHPQFWYDLSQTLVENIPEKINSSADQFEKLILWLWGIYTPLVGIGSGTLAILGNFFPSSITMILVLLPCVLLLFAYWFISITKSSVLVKFDANDASAIESSYNTIIHTKNSYFQKAQIITLLTCAIIPFSIYSYYRDKSEDSSRSAVSPPSFILQKKDTENSYQIFISGNYKSIHPTEPIYIRVLGDEKEIPIPMKAVVSPKPTEVLEISFDVPEKTKIVKCTLEWRESKEEAKSWTKTIFNSEK